MIPNLRRHYRRLIFLCAVPLILAIFALGGYQFQRQHEVELDGLRQMVIAQQLALNQIIKSTQDYVGAMRLWAEDFLLEQRSATAGSLANRWQVASIESRANLDSVPSLQRDGIGTFIGNPSLLSDKHRPEIDMALGLRDLMRLEHRAIPYIERSYYLSAGEDFSLYYPWRDTWQLGGGVVYLSIEALLQAQFSRAVYQHAVNSNHSSGGYRAYWTDPYWEAASGLVVAHAAPVYRDGTWLGVVGADVRLDFLTGFLRSMRYPAGQLWIVNASGQVLADGQGRAAHAGRVVNLTEVAPVALREFAAERLLSVVYRFSDINGQKILTLPLTGTPWSLFYVIAPDELYGLLLPQLMPYAIILAGLVLTLFLTQLLLQRRFINPALTLVDYIGDVAGTKAEPPALPKLPSLWRPGLRIVADTFAANRSYVREIRDSEAQKAAIINSALDGIIAIDQNAKIIEFNPRAERLFGYRREVAIGLPLTRLISAPDEPPVESSDEDHWRHFTTRDLRLLGKRTEMQAQRANGTVFPIELALTEIKLAERRLFTVYARDLTQQKQAEAEIARQREALYQSEKLSALNTLLAGVAHELNNPLAIVIGRAIMLESETVEPAMAKNISKIRDAAERCSRIVKTFLNIAQQRSSEPRRIQLNEVILGATDIMTYGLRKHNIELLLDLDEALPELWADPDQFSQVFVNLIVNAERAMQASDKPRRLAITTGYDDHRHLLRIEVSDSGPGIPEEMLSRVFEPFYTTKGPGVGLGSGLSVSHAIIRSHHGSIDVGNSEQGGARFTIILPALIEAMAEKCEIES